MVERHPIGNRVLALRCHYARNVADTPFFEPSPVSYIIDPARPLLIRSQTLIAGRIVRPHAHPRGQYAWAKKGVLRIVSDHAASGSFLQHMPSGYQAGTRHQVVSETPAEVRHVFVDPSRAVRTGSQRPDRCAVLADPADARVDAAAGNPARGRAR